MHLTKDFSEFNLRMINELQGIFNPNVEPWESEDGTLLFRGPIEGHENPKHIGTHVAVSLEMDVRIALRNATPEKREEMTERYLSCLGTEVKCQYNPKKLDPYALDIVGHPLQD
ncbi:MAG: hypothetical protein DID92_2727743869 [Candidatus Nitrotoga sp. SPKER]|nr:MAG: hypothetical protein DID92_2727743869 [Candidatus Nitrotoga sp. SPKER]